MQQTPNQLDTKQEEKALRLSKHARQRMQQRAIHRQDMAVALYYGDARWSHSDMVYILTDRSLLGSPYERQIDRLRGLCVVVTSTGVVKSVMWNFRIMRRPGVLRRSRRQ